MNRHHLRAVNGLAVFGLTLAVAFAAPVPVFACDRPLRPHEIIETFANTLQSWSGTHALAGRVWSRDAAGLLLDPGERSETFTDCAEPGLAVLVDEMVAAKVVLFGEDHDNPAHHDLQAAYALAPLELATLRRQFTVPEFPSFALVFEQLRIDQQPALDAFAALPPEKATLDEFKRFINWEKSGWEKYKYEPVFKAALKSKLTIYAGDVPRQDMIKVASEGEASLPEDERKRLALDTPLGDKLDQAALEELYQSHCRTMPVEALGGLAFAQRYRDANLADVALKAAGEHGSAIVFAGNGHVRTDRGVPWYIRQRAPSAKVVSIMLIEVEDGKTDPDAYVPRDPDGEPAADYIIFTPKAERQGDPCDQFKKQ